MPPVFQSPKDLIDEFKKSGEFDRLRRQLLTHFANSDEVRPLMTRVEEIAREKLSSDVRLEHKTREVVHSEVMQELERYPIIERAVSELAVLNDETLITSIQECVRNILQGESNDSTNLWSAQPSRPKTGDENDDSSDYSEDEDGADDDMLVVKPHMVVESLADPNVNDEGGPKAVINSSTLPLPPPLFSPAKLPQDQLNAEADTSLRPKSQLPSSPSTSALRLKETSSTNGNDDAMDTEATSVDRPDEPSREDLVAADMHPEKHALESHTTANSLTPVPPDAPISADWLKSPGRIPEMSLHNHSSPAREDSPRSITRSPTPRTP